MDLFKMKLGVCWWCHRCQEVVSPQMRCACVTSPSPWEPIDPLRFLIEKWTLRVTTTLGMFL